MLHNTAELALHLFLTQRWGPLDCPQTPRTTQGQNSVALASEILGPGFSFDLEHPWLWF